MIRINRARALTGCLLALSCLASLPAAAQSTALTELMNNPDYRFTPIERIVALNEEAALNAINSQQCTSTSCGPAADKLRQRVGAFESIASALNDRGSASLSSTDKTISAAVRPAAEGGSTPGERLAVQRLGDALRAAAPEEYSAQRSANTEFANNQQSSLTSRITALRFGAQGFSVAGLNFNPALAEPESLLGGAAGADGEIIASRWGGFFNGAYGWGKRDASGFEDAFDFKGVDLAAGVDYRLSNRFVVGSMLGYADQKLDFDPVISQTRGNMNAKGYNLNIYALYEADGPYVSGSLGQQKLQHDSVRHVQYQLFNPDGTPAGAAVDETERGSTDSTMWTSTLDLGWSMHANAFSYEPYLRFEYRNMKIDGFRESSIDNTNGTVGAFGANVAERTVKSLASVAGFRAQYAWTPTFGVLVPYAKAEYHHESHDDALQTQAAYTALSGVATTAASAFGLPSDSPDQSYYIVGIGSSLVLKGGLQGFLQYQKILGLEKVTHQSIVLGLRSEF